MKTVIVNGRMCMHDRVIDGINDAQLLAAAQRLAERTWANWQDWDTLGRSGERCAQCRMRLCERRDVGTEPSASSVALLQCSALREKSHIEYSTAFFAAC